MKILSRILAIVFAAVMLFGVVPTAAVAKALEVATAPNATETTETAVKENDLAEEKEPDAVSEAEEPSETGEPSTTDEPPAAGEDSPADEMTPSPEPKPSSEPEPVPVTPATMAAEIMPLATANSWTAYGRPGHATALGDTVSFRGHTSIPFTALLYNAATDGDYRYLTFHLSEGTSDWHTLEGTGFLFNSGIVNGVMNGYAVLFGQANVGFYKLTNVNISALAGSTFSSLPGVSLIEQKPKPSYSQGTTWYLRLVMSPGTLKVEKYADTGFTQLSETIFTSTLNDTLGGTGYGPFASFISHDCESISTSRLEYFNLEIKPNTPPTISAPDVVLSRGATFSVMQDVRADDAEDGNLSGSAKVVSSTVNVQVPGEYRVQYAVTDLAGGSANHARRVTVLADALFHVYEAGTGKPIAGVGITMDGHSGTLSASGADGKTSTMEMPIGTYQWEVSKQHEDYLPRVGKESVRINSTATTSWPLMIPVELTKKYHDVGVQLQLIQIDGETVAASDTARYNQTATFQMTVTNNSNQTVVPTVALEGSEEIALTGSATVTGKALEPGEAETIEVVCRVTSLKESATAALNAKVTKLTLAATQTVVPDENSENDTASEPLPIRNIPVILTKVDALTERPLSGVAFELLQGGSSMKLSRQENGTWVVDAAGSTAISTDESGRMTIYGLEPGRYALKETRELPGYVLPAEPWPIEINEDGDITSETELVNEPTAVTVEKIDASTGERLGGATFQIADADGKVVPLMKQPDGVYYPDPAGEATFPVADGFATIRYLPTGRYTLTEVIPPAGFATAEPREIQITDGHDVKTPLAVTVADKPLTIRIRKVTEEKKPLGGAGFTLTVQGASEPLTFSLDEQEKQAEGNKPVGPNETEEEDGAVEQAEENVSAKKTLYRYDPKGTITTIMVDEAGEALICQVPKGELVLTESVVPAGYSAAEPIEVELTEEHDMDTPLKVEVVNLPLVIHVRKVTEEKKPLGGAGFTITVQGSSEPLTFSLDEKKERDEESEQAEESESTEKPLYRYDPAGAITTITVDGSGEAFVYEIPKGRLTLTETVVPTGYSAAEPVEVELTEEHDMDTPLEVTVTDLPLVIHIQKVTEENRPLGGAGFTMTAQGAKEPLTFSLDEEVKTDATDGEDETPEQSEEKEEKEEPKKTIYRYDPEGTITTITVDGSGEAFVYEIPKGKLTLTETVVPDGYSAAEPIAVELTEEHDLEKPLSVTVTNLPLAIRIKKVTDEKKPLSGAGFTVKIQGLASPLTFTKGDDGAYRYDPLSETATIMVDESGEALIYQIPEGKITLTEVVVPTGYTAAEPTTFTLTQKHDKTAPLEVTVTNLPLAIRLSKITKDRQRLGGAGFELTPKGSSRPLTFTVDRRGVYRYTPTGKTTTIMVNATGEALVYGIPAGELKVTEVIVPVGYVHMRPVWVTVEAEHTSENPLRVTAINDPIIKLGFDSDQWHLPVAIILLAVAMATGAVIFFGRKKK